jgi:hypothetical protein
MGKWGQTFVSSLHLPSLKLPNLGRDEHFNRSADCTFFTLINNQKQSPKRTKTNKGRTSKVSRISTQSAFTVASDTASLADLPAEEGDSIWTTATNATVTTQGGRKMGKGKKPIFGKGRKTKAKKDEAIEVVAAPEPEDDDFEVKVDVVPKPTQGRKRKTDETVDLAASVIESQPPAKRRATRTRASTAMDESTIINPDESVQSVAFKEPPKTKGRKTGRSSIARSTRKASAASVATLEATIPNDEEIDAALEADLERPLSDDEQSVVPSTKGTRSSKITKADHSMFGIEHMEVEEAAIESELQTMEAESKPLPKAKGAKGKQPRKVSAKQQAAARKAEEAEAEAEAQRVAEEDASRQVAAELEHSLSIHHSSPNVQPKRQRASSRQPSRRLPGRNTRGSVMSVNESTVDMTDEFHDGVDDQKDDSGNETDASMASQSTVVRGGSTRRGSTMKKGRGGKKVVSRNIEEIVRKPKDAASEDKHEELPVAVVPDPEPIQVDESTAQEEDFYTPAPEAAPMVEDPISKARNSKAAPKGRGRPAKAAPASRTHEIQIEPKVEPEPVQEASIIPRSKTAKGKTVAPRSPTPHPKETTPAESPQSSDAENHPPSSKPSASAKKPTTPHATTARVPLIASTPMMSPSKRNIIAGLQSAQPWIAVDLDGVFLKSPGDENASGIGLLGEAMQKVKNGDLTSPEKRMTVEEWIHYNAEVAEEKLRGECEAMVGAFEREGGRAMRALEGVECVE